MGPPEGIDTKKTAYWHQLLEKVAEGSVVPIIGRDLLTVEDGPERINLYTVFARKLAARLGIEFDPAAILDDGPLNTVACRYILDGGEPDEIYQVLSDVVSETQAVPVPASLTQLAAIRPFNLFVTTTFDDLLERAVRSTRNADPQVLAYSTRSRGGGAPLTDERPTIYHVFGRVSPLPDYVVTEEDALEFMFSLQSSRTQPTAVLQRLWQSNLLIIGCSFPAWAVRFFLRLAREKRLLFADRERVVYTVDPQASRDPGFLQFLRAFRTRVEVISDCSGEDFCAELSRRWAARADEAAPDVPEAGSVFVSYASEDRDRVERFVANLKGKGFKVWFDRQALGPGDPWRQVILQGIRQCSAFIPVLSKVSATETAREYRVEWTEAIDWSRAMAADDRFLFPVVIDEIPPDAPSLPTAFPAVNWTRVENGTVPDELAQRLSEAIRRKKMVARR